jgi:hypothetical protein
MTPSEIRQKFEQDLTTYISDKIRLLEEETKLRVEGIEVEVAANHFDGETLDVRFTNVSIRLVA